MMRLKSEVGWVGVGLRRVLGLKELSWRLWNWVG